MPQNRKSNAAKKKSRGKGSNNRNNAARQGALEERSLDEAVSSARNDIVGVVLAVVSVALFISLVSPSSAVVTHAMERALTQCFGVGAFLCPFALFLFSLTFFMDSEGPVNKRVAIGLAVIVVALLSMFSLNVQGAEADPNLVLSVTTAPVAGGYVGGFVAWVLLVLVGRLVGNALLVGIIIIAVIICGFSISEFVHRAHEGLDQARETHVERKVERAQKRDQKKEEREAQRAQKELQAKAAKAKKEASAKESAPDAPAVAAIDGSASKQSKRAFHLPFGNKSAQRSDAEVAAAAAQAFAATPATSVAGSDQTSYLGSRKTSVLTRKRDGKSVKQAQGQSSLDASTTTSSAKAATTGGATSSNNNGDGISGKSVASAMSSLAAKLGIQRHPDLDVDVATPAQSAAEAEKSLAKSASSTAKSGASGFMKGFGKFTKAMGLGGKKDSARSDASDGNTDGGRHNADELPAGSAASKATQVAGEAVSMGESFSAGASEASVAAATSAASSVAAAASSATPSVAVPDFLRKTAEAGDHAVNSKVRRTAGSGGASVSRANAPVSDGAYSARTNPSRGLATPEAQARTTRNAALSRPSAGSQAASVPASSGVSSAAQTSSDDGYELPPLSMLSSNPNSGGTASTKMELDETKEALQSTLGEFGLRCRVVDYVSGPLVTTFRIEMGEGERVTKIKNLEDDIALTLAAEKVRIYAPIPGTSYVGVEIPNKTRQNVHLGDVLPYAKGGPLEVAIGRDSAGKPVIANIAKMPHMLVAGTTGSGKSVMINSMIMSLLMRTTPKQVRLIMIDPKRVEFTSYNGLPHLYVPVVTEPRQAASALQWAVSEMERRLKVFERAGARNIKVYNKMCVSGKLSEMDNPPEPMPYIVIIIDELSDLMMVAGKDVEASIVRIAQLARAAGIHLIIATQRPSANVVTGLIKSNIDTRAALKVSSVVDSRVILDEKGAERLLGNGDMLFKDRGLTPRRVLGCYTSDSEIAEVVQFIRDQAEPDYHEEILTAVTPNTPGSSSGDLSEEDDPLVWEAAQIVVESQLGSTSGLQRRLKVGYARAGRIMDMLEAKGVVGPPDGSKPREVLLDQEGLEDLRVQEAKYREVE